MKISCSWNILLVSYILKLHMSTFCLHVLIAYLWIPCNLCYYNTNIFMLMCSLLYKLITWARTLIICLIHIELHVVLVLKAELCLFMFTITVMRTTIHFIHGKLHHSQGMAFYVFTLLFTLQDINSSYIQVQSMVQ